MLAKHTEIKGYKVMITTHCYYGSKAIILGLVDNMPKILEYNGELYARVSCNTDSMTVMYTMREYDRLAKPVE